MRQDAERVARKCGQCCTGAIIAHCGKLPKYKQDNTGNGGMGIALGADMRKGQAISELGKQALALAAERGISYYAAKARLWRETRSAAQRERAAEQKRGYAALHADEKRVYDRARSLRLKREVSGLIETKQLCATTLRNELLANAQHNSASAMQAATDDPRYADLAECYAESIAPNDLGFSDPESVGWYDD